MQDFAGKAGLEISEYKHKSNMDYIVIPFPNGIQVVFERKGTAIYRGFFGYLPLPSGGEESKVEYRW